jgi:hypothetical protein
MLHSNFLFHVLTEDELSMLLYMVQNFKPPGFGLEVTVNLIKSYRLDLLRQIVRDNKDKVLDEALPIYESLCKKLGV